MNTRSSLLLSFALATVGALSTACTAAPADDVASSDHEISSAPTADAKLSKSDDGTTVKVTPGGKIVLSLPENGSTGYIWMIKASDLGAPEQHFIAPTPDVPGSSGMATFTWSTAGMSGSHRLELILQRVWAETTPPIDRFSVTLDFSAVAPAICGGFHGATCANDTDYCAYAAGSCGADDRSGVCAPRASFCPAVVSPVCGCDGKTYGNACEAARQGASIKFHGACQLP